MLRILMFCICFLFYCDDNSDIMNEEPRIIVDGDAIYLASLGSLSEVTLSYNFPNMLNPNFVINSNDTLSLSKYVKISSLNHSTINALSSRPQDYKHYSIEVKIDNYIQTHSHLICLSDIGYGKDILVWKREGDLFKLINIYPSQIALCLYCNPDFYEVYNDSFSIGTIGKDEGSIYGGYKYFTIHADTLYYYKSQVISGHYPFFEGSGNPVDGATCMGYFNIYYSLNGEKHTDPIYYTCTYENGDTVYAKPISDTLNLYQMYWQGIGQLLRNVSAKDQIFKVGKIIYSHGESYIAIEYENVWYWTLKSQIEI